MMRILIPVIVVLLGIGIGGGAGFFLAPAPPEPMECDCEAMAEGDHGAADAHGEEAAQEDGEEVGTWEYVNLNSQFVVPVIEEKRMTAMLVLSLSLEIAPASKEQVYAVEPKLRDEFLQLLFAYSNMGGFGGNFLEANDMKIIRADLTKAAQKVLGPVVNQVLIVDLVRQGI